MWPTDDHAASAHSRQHLADALIDFFAFDYVCLERAMHLPLHRTDRQCDQIRIILKASLQTGVVTQVRLQTIAAGDLESSRQTDYDLAIALAIQLDLPSLVSHKLRLVSTFSRPQLLRTSSR